MKRNNNSLLIRTQIFAYVTTFSKSKTGVNILYITSLSVIIFSLIAKKTPVTCRFHWVRMTGGGGGGGEG